MHMTVQFCQESLYYFSAYFNPFLFLVSISAQRNIIYRGCPRGVMVNAMDCEIVVREFVLQSRYYVHFRASTLGKGMNPPILPAMG